MYLQKIQKVLDVFRILTKIYMVCAFVAMGFMFVTGITALVQGDPLIFRMGDVKVYLPTILEHPGKHGAEYLADGIAIMFCGIVSTFMISFMKFEAKEGTPFTEKCADKLKKLGISIIVCSGVCSTVQAAILSMYHITNASCEVFEEFTLGIVFIIVSMILRYGATLKSDSTNKPKAELTEENA